MGEINEKYQGEVKFLITYNNPYAVCPLFCNKKGTCSTFGQTLLAQ